MIEALDLGDPTEHTLRDSARHLFAEHWTRGAGWNLPDQDRAVWDLVGEGGWLELIQLTAEPAPPDTLREIALLVGESGRACGPSVVRSGVFGLVTLRSLGVQRLGSEVVRALASGSKRAVVAFGELGRETEPPVRAVRSSAGLALSGTAELVLDAPHADYVLVPVVVPDGFEPGNYVVVVDPSQPGCALRSRAVFGGDPCADVVFTDCEVAPAWALEDSAGGANYDRALAAMTALLAVEMSCGSEGALQSAVDYAQQRQQFGRAIGTFQAVQHILADAAIGAFTGRLTADAALADMDDRFAIAVAKLLTARNFVETTLAAHEVYGGIGYSTELPLYRYSNRAKLLSSVLGDAHHQLDVIAGARAGTTT